jgi:Xaa-Pro aminopeptidase
MSAKARRDALRGKLDAAGADAVLVTKLPNVRYLTGFSGSAGQLLVGADDVFVTDTRYEEQSARQAPEIRREIYRGGNYWELIAGQLAGVKRLAVEAAHLTLLAGRKLAEAAPNVSLVETEGLVEGLRTVKDSGEIERIRRACAIADEAFNEVLGRLNEGLSELDVAAMLEDSMRRAGSEGLSFDTIVAFGANAAEPHHAPAARTLRSGDFVKMDFGATFDGYHSDMTRTVAFGNPSDEMAKVYDIVRAGQQAGLWAVKAGAKAADVDTAARAPLKAAGYDFGHGTGHGCGLEIHEAPGVRGESTDVLTAGMTVTVEPGIYLPGVGGVRIEDLVAVTQDGCDILTNSPKELIIV